MTVERIPIRDRIHWLTMRKNDVTASDIASLAGLSPYRTALEVWAEKKGRVDDRPDNPMLRGGRIIENSVVEWVREERPDWRIEKPNIYLRDRAIRLGATPDALACMRASKVAVLECKVVADLVYNSEWADGVPIHIQLQALTQAMLYGTEHIFVAALVLGSFRRELKIFPVERHAAAEEHIRHLAADFWSNYALNRPPMPEYSRDGETIKKLWAPVDGSTIDLTGDNFLTDLLAEREVVSAARRVSETRLDAINAEILHKIDGHMVATCGDFKITNTITVRPEKLMPETSFPVLRVTRKKGTGAGEKREKVSNGKNA